MSLQHILKVAAVLAAVTFVSPAFAQPGGGMDDSGMGSGGVGGMNGGMGGGSMGRGKGGMGGLGGDPGAGGAPHQGGGPRRFGAPAGGEFDGTTFSCLQYTNSAGENSSNKVRGMFARLWIEGNLAGYYKAQNKLNLSSEGADRASLTDVIYGTCLQYPTVSILTIGLQGLGKIDLKLPTTPISDFSLDTYTCGQHVEAKSGDAGAAAKADLAEMWAFAFIQGYKSVRNADVIIPIDSKPVLTGALTKACTSNRATNFLEMTALVAEKVKLQ